MTAFVPKLGQVDPLAPAFLGDPYPAYEELRSAGPVHPTPYGFWLAATYEAATVVLRDPRFSNREPDLIIGTPDDPAVTQMVASMGQLLSGMLPFMDAPDHTRLRGLINKAFTTRRTEQLRPRITEITNEILDRALARGQVDAVREIAFELPVLVICELLGVPVEDRHGFPDRTEGITGVFDPTRVQEGLLAAIPGITWFFEYFSGLVEERRKHPGDDLVSGLIVAEESGNRLTHEELVGIGVLLLLAGHETSTHLIGNALLAFVDEPSQLELLRARPELARTAVDEVLRFVGPVQIATAPRRAKEDVDVCGVTIRGGETVRVLLASANRDATVFENADAFDITRSPNHHLQFGGGIHYCVGAPLARLEVEVLLGELVRRTDALALTVPRQDIRYLENAFMRGLAALPLRLSPRA